tara:strand:- start:357 stop:545 length:189 start_codon:yes stop_codon:yes gene_type:complete
VKAIKQVTIYQGVKVMKKQKKTKKVKTRNWLAVQAFQRSGAGKHKDKSKYTRKQKHKQRTQQ